MVNPFSELPLVIFTTLMPIAAGAYLAIALYFFKTEPNRDTQRAVDRMTVIPIILFIIGLIGAFFHLANPVKAMFAFSGFGRSPLSNEIVVASLFAIAVVIYEVLALTGKFTARSRKVYLAVVCVLAVMLAVFTGLAYYVETIPTWASIWPSVEQLGYLLMASTVGAFVVMLAGAEVGRWFHSAVLALAASGFVVTVFANIVHLFQVVDIRGSIGCGAPLVSAAIPYASFAGVIGIIVLLSTYAALKKPSVKWYGTAAILLIVGVFFARLAFYCLQMNIGL